MRWIWPIKAGSTLFDAWSFGHVSFWVLVGTVFFSADLAFHLGLSAMFTGAGLWELTEGQIERRWPHLMIKRESLVNAVFGDVLICGTLGLFLGYRLYGLVGS